MHDRWHGAIARWSNPWQWDYRQLDLIETEMALIHDVAAAAAATALMWLKHVWAMAVPHPLHVEGGGDGDKARGDDNVFRSSPVRSFRSNLSLINFI